MEILTWNFGKKLFWKNFSEIFAQTKGILYQNLSNFALLSAIFILRPYCAEKIHTSIFICCLHPDSSHKIDNNFFIDHCQGQKEGSFVCEIVCFFSWVNSHPFHLKFIAFCPEFSRDSYVEFQEKPISGEFFRIFRANQGYPLQNLVKFRPTFYNFYSPSVLH